jgi:hypothetical protein
MLLFSYSFISLFLLFHQNFSSFFIISFSSSSLVVISYFVCFFFYFVFVFFHDNSFFKLSFGGPFVSDFDFFSSATWRFHHGFSSFISLFYLYIFGHAFQHFFWFYYFTLISYFTINPRLIN